MYFCKPLKLLKHITDNCIVNGSIALFVFSIALSLLNGAHANPSLNTVLKGSAQVSSTATTTTITQTSQSTTLNWNSFDVSQNQRVTFNQPSSSSIAINNILDTSPSQIFGSITANGRIVLLNPNGFYFGARSSVSANTFIAAATTLANSSYNPSTNSLSLVNRHDVVSDIQVLGSIHAQKVQLFAQTIEVSGTISSNQQGFISIRSNQDIRITGSISSHNGTIDIFALDGTASTSGTISTATGINDEAVEGFVEFSGSVIDIQPTAVFDLNPQDTLLFDPEYIVIVGGAIPTPCPPASSGIMDCGFTMGTELSGGTATVSAIYENTLEGITAGTIRLQADFGIQFLGTFTSGLTLAPNVSLELETTLTTTAPAPTVTLGGVMTTLSQGITISENITVMSGDITITSSSGVTLTETTITANGATVGDITILSNNSINLGSESTLSSDRNSSLTSTVGSLVVGENFSLLVGGSLTLSAANGSIGISGLPVTIARSSGSWTSTNLTLVSRINENIYLQTNTAGVLNATINDFSTTLTPSNRTGILSFTQTNGTIAITRLMNAPDATIILEATAGAITWDRGLDDAEVTITANTISLTASGNIGTELMPLSLLATSTMDESYTLSSTGTSGSIYLKTHADTDVNEYLSGTIMVPTQGELVLQQLNGDINLSGVNHPTINITILSSAANITFSGSEYFSSRSLTLEATGSIGTSDNPILYRQGSGGVLMVSSCTGADMLSPNCAGGGSILITSDEDLSIAEISNNIVSTSTINRAITVSANSIQGTDSSNPTITAGANTTISLTADTTSIGTSTVPILINATDTHTATNLQLTATDGSIYVSQNEAVLLLLDGSIDLSDTGTLGLTQVASDIQIISPLIFPADDLQSFSLTATAGAITWDRGLDDAEVTITANTISLTASGNIGTELMPLSLLATSTMDESYTLSSTGTSGSIYLKTHADTDVNEYLSGTIMVPTQGELVLQQLNGDINLSGVNHPTINITILSSAANITFSGSEYFSSRSLTLEATGSIGTSDNPILYRQGSGGVLMVSSCTGADMLSPNCAGGGSILITSDEDLSIAEISNNIVSTSTINRAITVSANSIQGTDSSNPTITAGANTTISLTADTTSIGTSTVPILINATDTHTATNLQLTATDGSIYVSQNEAVLLLLDGSIDLSDTGTLGLTQVASDIQIISSISFEANELQTFSLTAEAGSIFAVAQMTTIRAPQIRLNAMQDTDGLPADGSSVGSNTNPLIIDLIDDNSSVAPNSENLTLTASGRGSIYLRNGSTTQNSDVLNYLAADISLQDGSLSLQDARANSVIQISDRIVFYQSLILRSASGFTQLSNSPAKVASLNLIADSGSIGTNTNPINIIQPFGHFSSTASSGSIYLSSYHSITVNFISANSGTVWVSAPRFYALDNSSQVNADTITFIATSGSIGNKYHPIAFNPMNASNLTLTAHQGALHIAHENAVLSLLAGSIAFNGMLSLTQYTGDIAITGLTTLPTYRSIALRAIAGSITSALSLRVSDSILLEASESIGTSANPILLSRSSGNWNNSNLVITAGTMPGQGVYLSHETDVLGLTSGRLTGNIISLTQTTHSLIITNILLFNDSTFILNAPMGSISSNVNGVSIAARSLVLTANPTTGSIGTTTNPIVIVGTNEGGGSDSFSSISATAMAVYLSRITSAGVTATQTALPSAVVSLYLPTGSTDITPTNCMLTGAPLSLSSASITNSSLCSLMATDISLTATSGDIGSLTHPVRIGSQTLTNLTLSASGSIYLELDDILSIFEGTTPTVTLGDAGYLVLIQNSGDVTAENSMTFNYNLHLETPGDIVIQSLITADSLRLVAGGSLSFNANGAISTDDLTVQTVGDIGSDDQSISISTISSSRQWNSTNIRVTTSENSDIYISTDTVGVANFNLQGFATGILFLEQSVGIIEIDNQFIYPNAHIILEASDRTPSNAGMIIDSDGNGFISARRLQLIALGSIGSKTSSTIHPISIDVGWTRSSLDSLEGTFSAQISSSSGSFESDLIIRSVNGDNRETPLVIGSRQNSESSLIDSTLNLPVNAVRSNDIDITASFIDLSQIDQLVFGGYRTRITITEGQFIYPQLVITTSSRSTQTSMTIATRSNFNLILESVDYANVVSANISEIRSDKILIEANSGQFRSTNGFTIGSYASDVSRETENDSLFSDSGNQACGGRDVSFIIIGICTPQENIGESDDLFTIISSTSLQASTTTDRVSVPSGANDSGLNTLFVARDSVFLRAFPNEDFRFLQDGQNPQSPTKDAVALGSILAGIQFSSSNAPTIVFEFSGLGFEQESSDNFNTTWGFAAFIDREVTNLSSSLNLTINAPYSEMRTTTQMDEEMIEEGDSRFAQSSILNRGNYSIVANSITINVSGSVGGYVEQPGRSQSTYYLVRDEESRLRLSASTISISSQYGFIYAQSLQSGSTIMATAEPLLNYHQANVPVLPTGSVEIIDQNQEVLFQSSASTTPVGATAPLRNSQDSKGFLSDFFQDIFSSLLGADCAEGSNFIAQIVRPLCQSAL